MSCPYCGFPSFGFEFSMVMSCPYCGFTGFGFEFSIVMRCPNCTRYFYNDSVVNVNAEEREVLNKAVIELNRNVFSKPKRCF